MTLDRDPNTRRRVDPQTQRRRDAEVARLRGGGVTFRAIAARLDMSLGAVQKAVRRAQRHVDADAQYRAERAAEIAELETLWHDDDDGGPEYTEPLTISRSEQIRRQVAQLGGDRDDLVWYRLRHLMSASDFQQLCARLGRTGT